MNHTWGGDPVQYLRERGFTLHPDFTWSIPQGFVWHWHDIAALHHLHLESDYSMTVRDEAIPLCSMH